MKRFRFRLKTVLDVRRLREEKIQKEFGAIQKERRDCLENIARIHQGEEELRDYQRDRRGEGKISGVEEAWYAEKQADFMIRGMNEQGRLREIEARLEKKRQELVQASKDRKVLEQLEENQRVEYMKELSREEQNFLDELAQNQDARSPWAAADAV